MTRARFIGDPRNGGEGPESLSLFGVEFTKGEWTEVPASTVAQFAWNSHFEVDANEDGQADPDIEDVRARLRGLGIAFHHKAGLPKLLALLPAE